MRESSRTGLRPPLRPDLDLAVGRDCLPSGGFALIFGPGLLYCRPIPDAM